MDWLSWLLGLWFDALIVCGRLLTGAFLNSCCCCPPRRYVCVCACVCCLSIGCEVLGQLHGKWEWIPTFLKMQGSSPPFLSQDLLPPSHPNSLPPLRLFHPCQECKQVLSSKKPSSLCPAVSLIQKPPSPPLAILSLCASLFWLRRLQCSPKALNGYLGCRVQQVMLPWTQPSNWLCLAD